MASYRYRAMIPAMECAKHGINAKVNEGDAHIIVFSKPMLPDLDLAKKAKGNGTKVLVDFGDDHFKTDLYRDMAEIADGLVAPTKNMAERLFQYTGKLADVIPDPYEMQLCEPHAEGNNALWFGHNTNLNDLEPWKKFLNGYDLRIVTGPKVSEGQVKWSVESLKDELAMANVVLLPTRKGVEYKSPNRLINAVRAGCFPVCSRHPSYTEFSMVWVGDIRTGLQWAKSQQSLLNELVKEAQEYVEKYSPQVVGKQWAQMLGAL